MSVSSRIEQTAANTDLTVPPGLDAILPAFAALATLRRETAETLPAGPADVPYDPEQFAAGTPLLAPCGPAAFEAPFLLAATTMLPRIGTIFPSIAKEALLLAQALAKETRLAGPIVGAVLGGLEEDIVQLAGDLGLSPESLVFLAHEVLAAVLRRGAMTLAPMAEETLWHQGYCPICGGAPDIGMLKEKPEPSEFLIAKAGRLSLHCSLCGHLWRFPRLQCPACGEGDQKKLDLLIPAGRERERIHTCATCHHYLIVLNRVECERTVDLDIAPVGLAHLDIVAREKGFTPLCETPWNQGDDADETENTDAR